MHATARRTGLTLAIAAVALVIAAVSAQPAAARPACVDAILHDWAAGALGSRYALDCYDAAIDALPEDLRAYTTAADDISRAAIAASRKAPARELASSSVEHESVRAFPRTVLLLAVLMAVLLATGLAASLIRRRRAR